MLITTVNYKSSYLNIQNFFVKVVRATQKHRNNFKSLHFFMVFIFFYIKSTYFCKKQKNI